MRTLLVVLLMTCVSVCSANPVQQPESKVVRKTIVVRDGVIVPQNEAVPTQQNVIVNKVPTQTQKTVIVKEVAPQTTHKTVIIKEVPRASPKIAIVKEVPARTPQTIIVKKKVKTRKICRRYRQNGTLRCEERVVPVRVEKRRIYDENFDVTYEEEVRPRRKVVLAPARVMIPVGFNLHFRL